MTSNVYEAICVLTWNSPIMLGTNCKLLSPLIVSMTVLFVSAVNTERKTSWQCDESGRCTPLRVDPMVPPQTLAGSIVYESQEICHLICGEFGSLWPKPTGRTVLGNNVVAINPTKLRFEQENPTNKTAEFVHATTEIFKNSLLASCNRRDCDISLNSELLVKIYVHEPQINLTWTTDESYSMDVSTSGERKTGIFIADGSATVQIIARTVFGARHALETLGQLIAIVPAPDSEFTVPVLIASAQIKDSPRYQHRGLMVDTARNFIPLHDIKRTLDAMATSKLNVFHWHATDSQSFPLHFPRVPQLARYGAYSARHVYTPDEVKHIIDYARFRGIRVIIELDAPSHAGNGWQWGPEFDYGDLAVCVNQQPWRSYCIQPPCGQLNPANSNLYSVLRNVYKDLLEILPHGESLHMGGDEVFFGCWNSTNEILEMLNNRGLNRDTEGFLQLWADYQSTALRLWLDESGTTGSRQILWSSHMTDPDHIQKYLPNNKYIIQTWVPSDDDLPKQLIAKGFQIIQSTKNAWYFDHGFWGQTAYYTWRTVYNNRISRHEGVLGGEACVWTELIDQNSLDTRTWPRAAAVAERLWSDPDTTAMQAEARFYRHRQRLVGKGIGAEAVAPKWCIQNEGQCQ